MKEFHSHAKNGGVARCGLQQHVQTALQSRFKFLATRLGSHQFQVARQWKAVTLVQIEFRMSSRQDESVAVTRNTEQLLLAGRKVPITFNLHDERCSA